MDTTEENTQTDVHFICQGECGNVSEMAGACPAEGCEGSLAECRCEEGIEGHQNEEIKAEEVTETEK